MCETHVGWNEQRLKREDRLAGAPVQHETTQTTQPFLSSGTTMQGETTQTVRLSDEVSREREYEGFIAKHRDWPVAWTKQDGVNCGMYAAAMAIRSLLTARKGAVEQKIDDIAKCLQTDVVDNKLSALGEMYDAEELAKAINRFLGTITSGTEVRSIAGKRYHAQAITVDSEEQFKTLLKECTSRGLRVLVPYLSYKSLPGEFEIVKTDSGLEAMVTRIGKSDEKMRVAKAPFSDTEAKNVKAMGMYKAHWGMVYELEEDGNVKMVEGNQGLTHIVPLANLFRSNESLVDKFPLGQFINSDAKRKKRLYDLDGSKTASNPAETIIDMIEVKLRHQVIVIGRSSDSYKHKAVDNTAGSYRVTKPEPEKATATARGPAAAAAAETDEDSK